MEEDAPRYTKGCILSIASLVGLVVGLVAYLFVITAINKKRNAKAQQGHHEYAIGEAADGVEIGLSRDSDLTDQQDKGFRYTT